MGLRSTSKLKVPELYVFNDSKLVVNQFIEKFKTRGAKMTKYLKIAKTLLTKLRAIQIKQVGRALNSHAEH